MKTAILIAVTLLAFAPPLTAAPVTARALPRLMPAPEFALQHESDLGLTTEQRAKLEAAVSEVSGAALHAEADVRRQSDALAVLLSGEKPDEAAVQAQFEKVLAAENEVKRIRLKLSLRTRAVLTAEQQGKVAALQGRGTRGRAIPQEQQELTARMERVKELIERAKREGRDLSAMREMWKRVDQLTRDGQTSEASRVLDETAQALESSLTAPPARK